MDTNRTERLLIAAAFAAIFLIWGTTYFAIRVALTGFPPFLLGALRFAFAGGLLLCMTAHEGRPSSTDIRKAMVPGVLLFLIGNGTVTYVEQRVPSAIVALFPALIPIAVSLFEWGLGVAPRPSLKAMLAFTCGAAGVGLVLGRGVALDGRGILPVDAAILLLGVAGWAFGTVFLKRSPPQVSAARSAGLQMLTAAGFFALTSLASGERSGRPPLEAVLGLCYLSVFGSIVAVTAYTYLLMRIRPSVVATYALVNPVIAMVVGSTLGGELLTASSLIGGALVLIAVASILVPAACAERARAALERVEPRDTGRCPGELELAAANHQSSCRSGTENNVRDRRAA